MIRFNNIWKGIFLSCKSYVLMDWIWMLVMYCPRGIYIIRLGMARRIRAICGLIVLVRSLRPLILILSRMDSTLLIRCMNKDIRCIMFFYPVMTNTNTKLHLFNKIRPTHWNKLSMLWMPLILMVRLCLIVRILTKAQKNSLCRMLSIWIDY